MITASVGEMWPGAEKFFARVAGRVGRIVCRTSRWEGGIDYCVRVNDPDVTDAREEDEDTCQVWAATVEFLRHGPTPSPLAVAAAREQERIAEEIWGLYGAKEPA